MMIIRIFTNSRSYDLLVSEITTVSYLYKIILYAKTISEYNFISLPAKFLR